MLMPSIARYMTRQPWTIGPDARASDAHRLMRDHRIRHLPVVDGTRLVGLVSERDLHLIETLPCGDPDDVAVQEAMVPDVFVAHAQACVDDVVETMAMHKYGCAVITNREGGVDGIFTTTDALQVLADVLRRATT